MTSRQLLLLTHTPRDGAVVEGYHEWIRSTDCPFFNSVPSIINYTVWQVQSGHPAVNFTHFDLLEFEGPVEGIFAYPPLDEFAGNWTKLWSQHPESSDPSVNYQAYACSHASGDILAVGGSLQLLLDSNAADMDEYWNIDGGLVGEPSWSKFSIKMLTPNSTQAWNDKEELGCIASLIAAPSTKKV